MRSTFPDSEAPSSLRSFADSIGRTPGNHPQSMALEEPDVLTVFSLLLDQTLRGPSVNPLSGYESGPGFFSSLMDKITAEGPDSDDDARLWASNYFEEAVTHYWQKNSSFISGYEKTKLRNRLLSHLREENDQKIVLMLVIVISKIAHFNNPQEWPELFFVLTKQLEKGDLLTSHRILEFLSQTNPSLPGKNLTPEISSYLFDYCWQLWKKDQGIIYHYLTSYNSIEKNTSMGQQQNLTFERWSLCLSIIQMLNVFGFRGVATFVKVPPVKEVCLELIGAVESLVTFYSISTVHPKLNSVHYICVNLMKCLIDIQKWNSTFLGDETVRDHIVKFCLDMITNSTDDKSPMFEQILIKCMVMLKSVLYCIRNEIMHELPNFNGKRVITRVERRSSPIVAENISSLPDEDVKDLCKILITRYFLLSRNELKEWSQDPERFYLETNTYHELDRIEKLRPHAEALFIEVFQSYKKLLGPVVVSVFHEATKNRPAKETDSDLEMFLREAAYTAVAHVFNQIFDKMDFEELFEKVLYPELESNHCPDMHNHHPDMRIIHRKITDIVKTWQSTAEGDMRKQVFCALLKLLEYDDLVVRLAACQSLRYLLEIDLPEKKSLDMLQSYWGLCFKLLVDVQDIHSKNLVLGAILSGIIEIGEKFLKNSGISNMGQLIFPFAMQLANEIEEAWEVLGTGLQIKVLRALCFLSEIEILSRVCYKIIRPTLEMFSLLKDRKTFIVLKYRLLLWESEISNVVSINAQLIELFPYLQEVMKDILDYYPRDMHHINDHLQVAFKIINGYIKLGGRRFLCDHASVIHKLLVRVDANLDFKPKKVRGRSKLDTKVFSFGARVTDRIEALEGKLKDTKTSVEEQEDEKNMGALDEIKEKHRGSASSKVLMRELIMLLEDVRKLVDSLRSAGMRLSWESVSAAVEELGETLLDLSSDIDMATERREEMAAEETNLEGTANHPPGTTARSRKRPRWLSNYVTK